MKISRKTGIIAACIALVIIIAVIIPKGTDKKPGGESISDEKDKTEQLTSEVQQLTIDVNNASNAYIVFPDGTTKKLPYAISGKEGENFQFTLQAEGYESKSVDVGITVGRKSYEYNLEKIKE